MRHKEVMEQFACNYNWYGNFKNGKAKKTINALPHFFNNIFDDNC